MPETPDRDAVDATDLDAGGSVTPGATPPDTNPVSGSTAQQEPPPTNRFSGNALFPYILIGFFVVALIALGTVVALRGANML